MISAEGLIIDGFAGCGGASLAIHNATGREPDIAINHSAVALECHARNHPGTRHLVGDIWDADPRSVTAGRKVDLLWMSPDCRHHSRLCGSAVRSARVRALPWVAVRWAKAVRPRAIHVENVSQLTSWSPLRADGTVDPQRRGQTYQAWIGAFVRLGYHVDARVLTASDYGARTTRRRLFITARLDGRPEWPTHVHDVDTSALGCIDWSLPWGRVPASPHVHKRMARALDEFGVQVPGVGLAGLITVGYGEREGQPPRALDLRKPLGTVVAGGSKHALVTEAGGFRRLTAREAARAQGFPDSFWLPPKESLAQHLVGNSVPVDVVAAIVRANIPQTRQVAA